MKEGEPQHKGDMVASGAGTAMAIWLSIPCVVVALLVAGWLPQPLLIISSPTRVIWFCFGIEPTTKDCASLAMIVRQHQKMEVLENDYAM